MLKFVQSKLSVFSAVAEGRITICWTQQTHTECMGYTTISHQPEDFQVGEKVVCLIHKQKSCKLLTARQRDAISFKTKCNFMVLIEEKPTHSTESAVFKLLKGKFASSESTEHKLRFQNGLSRFYLLMGVQVSTAKRSRN